MKFVVSNLNLPGTKGNEVNDNNSTEETLTMAFTTISLVDKDHPDDKNCLKLFKKPFKRRKNTIRRYPLLPDISHILLTEDSDRGLCVSNELCRYGNQSDSNDRRRSLMTSMAVISNSSCYNPPCDVSYYSDSELEVTHSFTKGRCNKTNRTLRPSKIPRSIFTFNCTNNSNQFLSTSYQIGRYSRSSTGRTSFFKCNISRRRYLGSRQLGTDSDTSDFSTIFSDRLLRTQIPTRISKLSITDSPSLARRRLTHDEDFSLAELGKCERVLLSSNSSAVPVSCLTQARQAEDISVNELAAYFDEIVHLPKKMCRAAESMYA